MIRQRTTGTLVGVDHQADWALLCEASGPLAGRGILNCTPCLSEVLVWTLTPAALLSLLLPWHQKDFSGRR